MNVARLAARIAAKDLRDVLRERTILVALAVQFVIAATSGLLAVGLLALYDADAIDAYPDATVAYVGPGGLDAHLRAPNLDIERMDAAAAFAAFSRGDVDAVVEEQFDDPGDVRSVTLLVPEGEVRTTLLVTQLKAALEAYQEALREQRAHRLDHEMLHVRADAPAQRLPHAFLVATVVPVLLLTPVFLSGAIAGDALVDEARRRTLLLLRSAPVPPAAIVLGKLAVPVLLAPAQALLWLGLLHLQGAAIHNVALLAALVAVLALLVCGAGAAVAALVRREGQMQAAYALLALALAGAAVFLPRDPLNVLALAANDALDAAAWWTVGAWCVAAAAAAVGAATLVARRLRDDRM